MSPPALGRGITSLGLVSFVRGVQSRARGSQHPWVPKRIPQERRGEGGTCDPTAQRAWRGGWGERRKRLRLEGGGGSARTHARL